MNTASQSAQYPSLLNRVVLITGGASGIGEAIVEAFVAQRAKVVFIDISRDAAEALVSRLSQSSDMAPVYYHCDLTNIEALQATVQKILTEVGAVDVLINNAGDDTRHKVEAVTSESWDKTMAVNLKQQFFMAQAVIPGMIEKRRGSIVNMSSIAWLIPSTNGPVYVAAKAAIVGMTRTLAHEYGTSEIRVNAVLPGAILTPRQRELWLTPQYEKEVLSNQALKRLLLPEEVARLMLFLASDDSSGITNQSVVVDGGWV